MFLSERRIILIFRPKTLKILRGNFRILFQRRKPCFFDQRDRSVGQVKVNTEQGMAITIPLLFCQHILTQILLKELLQLIERNSILSAAVIQIGMRRVRNDHKLFVVSIFAVPDHVGVSILAKITRMCLLAVNDQYSASDLITVL